MPVTLTHIARTYKNLLLQMAPVLQILNQLDDKSEHLIYIHMSLRLNNVWVPTTLHQMVNGMKWFHKSSVY